MTQKSRHHTILHSRARARFVHRASIFLRLTLRISLIRTRYNLNTLLSATAFMYREEETPRYKTFVAPTSNAKGIPRQPLNNVLNTTPYRHQSPTAFSNVNIDQSIALKRSVGDVKHFNDVQVEKKKRVENSSPLPLKEKETPLVAAIQNKQPLTYEHTRAIWEKHDMRNSFMFPQREAMTRWFAAMMEIYESAKSGEKNSEQEAEDEKNVSDEQLSQVNETLETMQGELKRLKKKLSDTRVDCRDHAAMFDYVKMQIDKVKGSVAALETSTTRAFEEAKKAAEEAVAVEHPKVAEKESELSEEAVKTILGKKFSECTTLFEFLDGYEKHSTWSSKCAQLSDAQNAARRKYKSMYESFNDAIDGQIGSFLLNNGVKLSKDDVAYALIVDTVETRLASVSGKSWKVEATRVRNAGKDGEAVAVIVNDWDLQKTLNNANVLASVKKDASKKK